MEVELPLGQQASRAKRQLQDSDSGSCSTSCSALTSGPSLAAAANNKRVKAQEAQQQEQQQQHHFFSPLASEGQRSPFPSAGPLQPADSSTSRHLAHFAQQCLHQQQQQQQQQHQPAMAQSSLRGALQRTSSAPELLKLAQADSAAWQNQHAATAGSNQQPAGFLSHQDHWLT